MIMGNDEDGVGSEVGMVMVITAIMVVDYDDGSGGDDDDDGGGGCCGKLC